MMRRFFTVLLVSFLAVTAVFGQFRKSRVKTAQPPVTDSNLNYANPTEYYIGGIEVTGLNILDKNAMISLTGLKIGDKIKIPGDQISGAIRKLWNHGLVGDAQILVEKVEGQNVFLTIKLAERPRLTEYYFSGISKSRQSSLKEDLKLIKGKIVNDAMIRNTEIAVKKSFTKKGFLNTIVKVYQELDTLNRGGIKLRVDVDLKTKVRINEILFEGNDSISSSKLKKPLKKTKEHARITLHRVLLGMVLDFKPRKIKEVLDSNYDVSWRDVKEFVNRNVKLNFFSGSKFIGSEYDADKIKMIDYYNTKGYRDAEIVSDTIVAHDEKTIDIKFKISEGNKYYFRNITWTGNYLHTVNTLNKILDIKKGDVYNKEMIDRKTTFNPKGADINGLYMDDGYLFFSVKAVEVAVEGDSIDIEMRIFEGGQATIDEVTISGNERTNDHVIRRELSTIPGQKFRRSDIIRTQQQLSSMGYFNPQKVEQDIKPNPSDGTVDIGWKVEEQSNDQIQLSGGWGGYFGFVGTAGITFNNFSLRNIPHPDKWRPLPVGDGQRLSLQAQANGKAFQSYSVSFTEPWLGGRKPNSLTVSLNSSVSRQSTSFYSNSRSSFDNSTSPLLKQRGITVGLGRRLEWPDNYFSLTNALSFLVYDYKNYPGLPNKTGLTNDFNLNTTLSRNSIDNPMYPTQGSTLSLSMILTPPYSLWRNSSYYDDPKTKYRWVEQNKWMFDAKFYIKILGSSKPNGRSLVLESKAHFGFINTYSSAIEPGPFGRFLLGGDGLAGGFNSFVLGQEIIGLRGYQNNKITPPSYAADNTGASNELYGGIVYSKLGLELRYPVTTGQTATIYGLIFTEAGNNWGDMKKFNPFNLYKSAGFGARIFMPAFGLIGLNWAYGFDAVQFGDTPGRVKSGSQFHFTIGQQLR